MVAFLLLVKNLRVSGCKAVQRSKIDIFYEFSKEKFGISDVVGLWDALGQTMPAESTGVAGALCRDRLNRNSISLFTFEGNWDQRKFSLDNS